MRIVCPSCDATYEVPKSLLGDGGKMVRCARCGKEWKPEAPVGGEGPGLSIPASLSELHRPPATRDDADAPAESDGAPGGGPGERLAGRPRRAEEPGMPEALEGVALRVSVLSRRMKLISVAAWVASAAVLMAAAATFVVNRPSIQAIFPASERLYRLLGMS